MKRDSDDEKARKKAAREKARREREAKIQKVEESITELVGRSRFADRDLSGASDADIEKMVTRVRQETSGLSMEEIRDQGFPVFTGHQFLKATDDVWYWHGAIRRLRIQKGYVIECYLKKLSRYVYLGNRRPQEKIGQRWYAKYLASRHWQEMRKRRLDYDGHQCCLCPETSYLQVHHWHYGNLGQEDLHDLCTLCRDCHTKIHEFRNLHMALPEYLPNEVYHLCQQHIEGDNPMPWLD